MERLYKDKYCILETLKNVLLVNTNIIKCFIQRSIISNLIILLHFIKASNYLTLKILFNCLPNRLEIIMQTNYSLFYQHNLKSLSDFVSQTWYETIILELVSLSNPICEGTFSHAHSAVTNKIYLTFTYISYDSLEINWHIASTRKWGRVYYMLQINNSNYVPSLHHDCLVIHS